MTAHVLPKRDIEIKTTILDNFWSIYVALPSAEGEKINWVNYKSGEKNILFKMAADNNSASIAIELTHPDISHQQLVFEQFEQMKNLLHAILQEDWIWKFINFDENGKLVSRIYTEIKEVSIYKKDDWPELIRFFKDRIIALDEFWSSAKYIFETFR